MLSLVLHYISYTMEIFYNFNDVIFNYYFITGGLFLSYLIYRILHTLLCDSQYLQIKYHSRGHFWRSIECNKSVPYNIYCSVCGKLMLPEVGLFCECCAVSACRSCHRAIDKKFRCKQITWPIEKTFTHHWVNVGVTQRENADNMDSAKRYFCSWCQRVRLSYDGVLNNTEQCDFQKYRSIIIPPTHVEMEKGLVRHIKPLSDDCEPLIVFANPKSGSSRSDEVLTLFRGLLNPVQVVDISICSPDLVIRWLPPRCRVIVAGGDGTVAWILNTLHKHNVTASVAILPMGTGNDLSRVLGWGPGCGSHLDAHSIIKAVRMATEQPLDRWKITIKPKPGRLRRSRPERVINAYNYASIGVDAQVALDFHRARTQFLYRYASRTLNYIAYAFLGAGRVLDAGKCLALERRIKVYLDDEVTPLSLPPLQGLVSLNIPSWGAGVDLWSMGCEEVPEQSVCDRKLEVAGISSSFQIARLQCGLAEPYRFAQASKVKIELKRSCPMQVDGEPWMQGAATITIQHDGQALMLRANPSYVPD